MAGSPTITVSADATLNVSNTTIRQVGAGAETLIVNGNHDTLIASTGLDTLIANGTFNVLRAGSGADVLVANGDNAILVGGTGANQQLTANGDNALVTGGSGAGQVLTVNGNNGQIAAGSGANQSLNLNGNNGSAIGQGPGDVIVANGNGDTLVAGATGTQTLTLYGDGGRLVGSAGAVNLVTVAGNNDVITIGSNSSCGGEESNHGGNSGCGGDDSNHGGGSSCGSDGRDGHSSAQGCDDKSTRGSSDGHAGCGDGSERGTRDSRSACDTQQSPVTSCDTRSGHEGDGSHQGYGCTVGDRSGDGSERTYTASACGDHGASERCDDGDRSSHEGSCSSYYGTELDACYNQLLSAPHNVFLINGNNDSVTGGAGTNEMTVNGNHDLLQGGASGVQLMTVNGNNDTMISGGLFGNLTANGNNDTLVAGAYGRQELTVNGNNDTLTGGGGYNVLTANGNNDTMVAGSGFNMLAGAGMNDTYKVALGAGDTQIVNGWSGNGGPANELDFGAGISDSQLWFEKAGNDLRIDIMGTPQEVTVAGWYTDPLNQLQTITTSDGLSLGNSQVSQLVQAMAGFSSTNPGFDPTAPDNTHVADAGVQGVIAASWQHA